MSTFRELQDLRQGARRLADMEEDGDGDFISESELTRYVNEGIADLYDARVDANPDLFAVNGPTLVTAGDFSWTLPVDFRQLVSVYIRYSGDYFTATPIDISAYSWAASQTDWQPYQARYTLREEFGTNTKELYIFPAISNPDDIAYIYIKQAPVLSLDTEQFYATYDELEYVETYAAIKMLSKEESDTSVLETRRAQLWSKINNKTKDSDIGSPRRVRNVRKNQYIDRRR